MLLTGELCKLIEQREALIRYLKEKETERVLTDIFNVDKYASLYEVLERIDMAILEEERKNDM